MSNRDTAILRFGVIVILFVVANSGRTEEALSTVPPRVTDVVSRSHAIEMKSKLQNRREKVKTARKAADAVKELLGATSYDELVEIPKRWRKEFSRKEFHLLTTELLRRMSSRRMLPFSKPDYILISPYFDPSEIGKSVERHRLGKPTGMISQDVYIEGGRCAYALSALYYLTNTLLPIWNTMSEEDYSFAVRENALIVLEAMALPDEIDFPVMTAEQRANLAAKTRHPEILRTMHHDSARQVRLALARRVDIAFINDGFLQSLTADTDPEVRAAAESSWKQFLQQRNEGRANE